MGLVGRKQTNEIRFCWEQVQRTNRLFRISRVFAPAERASQLLPLYALFGAVEEVCSKHSDEDVARHKLNWWRNECAGLGAQGSNHPILRELVRSGAHRALRQESMARLFDDAESRLDAAAPATLDELREHCLRVAAPQFELELSLESGTRPSPGFLETIGTSIGLAQLMRETAMRRPPAKFWWLPLGLLARHGVSRLDVGRSQSAGPVQAVFTELLEGYRVWCPKQNWLKKTEEQDHAPFRHLFVMGTLQASALRRLQPDRPEEFASELNRVDLLQLYRGWQAARQISRP